MPGNDYLRVLHLSKTYGTGVGATHAIQDISFSVGRGRFLSILGPSGCGKSTLFNIMAGLLSPSEGNVLLDGESIVGRPGHVGYMLQRDLLLPWQTIENNVMLAQTLQGVPKKQVRPQARALMEKCGLAGDGDKYPDQLSGGMRQRAALIRTLLTEKEVLLLDEPFGALDAITRGKLQQMLISLWEENHKTILFVTHDIEEALLLSDEVLVLSHRPGQVLEHLPVDLPRPRREDVMFTSEFLQLRSHLSSMLTQEVT